VELAVAQWQAEEEQNGGEAGRGNGEEWGEKDIVAALNMRGQRGLDVCWPRGVEFLRTVGHDTRSSFWTSETLKRSSVNRLTNDIGHTIAPTLGRFGVRRSYQNCRGTGDLQVCQ
jgi:hypothetical protein